MTASSPDAGKVVVYYVSGHGLGHATRAMEVMRFIVTRVDQLIVVSPGSREALFREHLPGPFEYQQRACDAEIVQQSALRVDGAASLAAYSALDRSVILERERRFLKGKALVVSDVAALPLRAAHDVGVPSVIVSNFTWLDIYAAMGSPPSILAEDYNLATGYLRLPGGSVTTQPLVARLKRTTREETRQKLGIPRNAPMVLLTFGGHTHPNFNVVLPESWSCVVLGGGSDLPTGFVAAPGDSYVPDLVHAADAVLGKLGYGSVSEALAHRVPFIWVSRRIVLEDRLVDWPEEVHLSKLLGPFGLRLEEEDFFQGRWPLHDAIHRRRETLSDLLGIGIGCRSNYDDVILPATQVADAILSFLP